MGHEPLGPSGVFARESHADRAAFVRHLVYFAPDLVSRPAIAVAARITILNYKVWYDTVDRNAFEVATFSELDKIINCERSILRQKLNGK